MVTRERESLDLALSVEGALSVLPEGFLGCPELNCLAAS